MNKTMFLARKATKAEAALLLLNQLEVIIADICVLPDQLVNSTLSAVRRMLESTIEDCKK